MNRFVVGSLVAIAAVELAPALGAQTDSAVMTQTPPSRTAVQEQAPSVVSGFRIIDISDDGSYITLQDSTRWEVYLPDRPRTVTWRKGDLAIVSLRPIVVGPKGGYRYEFADGRADSRAAVKFRGEGAAQPSAPE